MWTGSATVWLHMARWPKRVVTPTRAHSGLAYNVVNNDWSCSTQRLVFIDAPGAVQPYRGKDKEKRSTVDETACLRRFHQHLLQIRAGIRPNTSSAKYGTTRAAVLSNLLETNYAIDSMVIMLSQTEFRYERGRPQVNPASTSPISSRADLAATAWYHKQVAGQEPTICAIPGDVSTSRWRLCARATGRAALNESSAT